MFIFWVSSKLSGTQILDGNEIEFSARALRITFNVSVSHLRRHVGTLLLASSFLSVIARCRHVCTSCAEMKKKWGKGICQMQSIWTSSTSFNPWLFALVCIHRQTNTLTCTGVYVNRSHQQQQPCKLQKKSRTKSCYNKPNNVWHKYTREESLHRKECVVCVSVCVCVMKRRGRKCCHHFVVCSFPFVVRELALQHHHQWITSFFPFHSCNQIKTSRE